ncbi:hypothetical protein ABZX69_13630 [Streptomyces sp. NPDC004074]|uniref:hypothetical protein n=1 Tax=Streptomyces sp. NPDC004074 TaxID=3154277 RepID=UPI00339EB798
MLNGAGGVRHTVQMCFRGHAQPPELEAVAAADAAQQFASHFSVGQVGAGQVTNG